MTIYCCDAIFARVLEHFVHYRVKHMIFGLGENETNRSGIQIRRIFIRGEYRSLCHLIRPIHG